MTCPTCNTQCKQRTSTGLILIDGKQWVYEYREFACKADPPHTWMNEGQMQDALDKIKAAKEAAIKLKKAQP